MKKYFLYLCLSICLFSCGEKNNAKGDEIYIDLKKTGTLNFSEIADSISYIQLETTDESLIGDIGAGDILYRNGIFYISERSGSIYLFNEKGKYLSKLNKLGQGPGEYTSISSFALDTVGNIHVMDLSIKKILMYNCNAEFISETRIEDYPRDFYVYGNKYMLYMPDDNIDSRRGLYSLDRTTHKYAKIFDIGEDTKLDLMLSNYIVLFNDRTCSIVNNFNNTIFYMDGDQIQNILHFHVDDLLKKKDAAGEKKYLMASFNDYDNFLFLRFVPRMHPSGDLKFYIYDKKKKKGMVYNDGKNDIDSQMVGNFTKLSVGNKLVCILPGNVDENGEEENPILQFFHLKN
jgi:hypothetical protein